MEIDGTTLATIPAILAIIQLIKNLVPLGKWAALLSVVLGVTFSLLDQAFVKGDLTASSVYAAVIAGVFLGLGASGVYEGARLAGVRLNPITDARGEVVKYEIADGSGEPVPLGVTPPAKATKKPTE